MEAAQEGGTDLLKVKVVEFTRCVQNVSDWDLLNLFLSDSDTEMEL